MSNIWGTVIHLKEFLENKETSVHVQKGIESEPVFSLKKDRKYIIPDFQREIRWQKKQVVELLRDIANGQKFLGNIILTRVANDFEIIDGQQRITVLIIILHYLRVKFVDSFEVFENCIIINQNFSEFASLMKYNFNIESISDDILKKRILLSDSFEQRNGYKQIWDAIDSSDILSNSVKAVSFYNNLKKCDVNIIVNIEGSTENSIEYFIDVNLKGIRLDAEDIFKGYLFNNDSSREVRNYWIKIKELVFRLNKRRDIYSVVKLFEHYFYCDLFLKQGYESVVFKKEEFILLNDCTINNVNHYAGEHIIKALNSNSYMRSVLVNIIKYLEIIIDIIESSGPSEKFKELFTGQKTLDSIEYSIIHNLMKKILLDKDTVPKVLIMKYVLNVLLNKETNKFDSKKIYGVFFYATLFMIFSDKKDGDRTFKIVKHKNWYNELMLEIMEYFDGHNIQNKKIYAKYKYSLKEDALDERIRCKSLAAIYNYFEFTDNMVKVKKGKYEELKEFITNDEVYSIEHFIINKSKKVNVNYDVLYEYPTEVYSYRNSLFNFIFINKNQTKAELTL